ncbi:MAG TPA: acyl-CoA synthetase [Candidatus Dormibacteraeota bacterium]|nr:acyl-CoA synthetase [Candidatus Dormibacteraeota bacterium]
MEFNFADLFESIVDAVPDRLAVVCGDRRLAYAELDRRANRLAHHLAAAGVEPGQHVGVHLYNSTEFLECMLAAFKIRAVPVNVNYRYVAGELRSLFRDADLVALVHQRSFGPIVREVIGDVPTLRHTLYVDDGSGEQPPDGAVELEAATARRSDARGFAARSAGDLHVIYTGGTTGAPRGVIWRHEDLFFAGMGGGNPSGEPARRPEDVAERAAGARPMVTFPVPPLMHGAAQLGSFINFFQGGVVVLTPRFDPVEVWRLVERERVNTLSLVGDAMARPLAEALDGGLQVDASSLFVISSAGAIFSASVRDLLRRLVPHAMLLDNFGASETGFQGRATPDSSPEAGLKFAMNAQTTVLDESLRPVAPGSGVVGRVALSGRVPLGYYKDAVKTREVFVDVDGTRFVMPGDMAVVNEDGTITVLGRGSVCINSGGEKIFPEEVEAAVKSHPDVLDAVVVGVPDDRWGEAVAAVVASRPGRAATLEAVRAYCAERIARYKLPRLLVEVPEVVRSPSGKPDYGWARDVATRRLV